MDKPEVLPGDGPQAVYDARRLATQINLRKYYNACVGVMAREESGEITMDQALDEFLALDSYWAKAIVDDIAPKKSLLEI